MRNVISVASAKQSYDTAFVTRQLSERIAREEPDKKILTIYRSFGPDPEGVIRKDIYPFRNLPVLIDDRSPGLHSFYARSALNIVNLHPDLAVHIVRSFAEKYDLVICDAGGRLEDALALGCQFKSKTSYYVFDHTIESVKRLAWLRPLLDRLDIPIGGYILDHSNGPAEYSYYEYTRTLDLPDLDNTYIIDNDRNMDEIGMLAESICKDQFDDRKMADPEPER